MLITLIMTVLSTASSDVEKLVLYRLLADASTEMPEVIGMTYVASGSIHCTFTHKAPQI